MWVYTANKSFSILGHIGCWTWVRHLKLIYKGAKKIVLKWENKCLSCMMPRVKIWHRLWGPLELTLVTSSIIRLSTYPSGPHYWANLSQEWFQSPPKCSSGEVPTMFIEKNTQKEYWGGQKRDSDGGIKTCLAVVKASCSYSFAQRCLIVDQLSLK